ncbi:MAG: hypothetical protein RDU89_08195 [bacterium]|nr:hypothetical protein [bacterium]
MAEGFRSEIEELQEELERVRRKREEASHNLESRQLPQRQVPGPASEAGVRAETRE